MQAAGSTDEEAAMMRTFLASGGARRVAASGTRLLPFVLATLCALAAPVRAETGAAAAAEAYLAEAQAEPYPTGPALSRVLAAPDGERWNFGAAIYLWATSMDGTVSVRGQSGNVSVPFSELFGDLTGAFMGRFEARKGKWGVLVDIFWCSLEDTSTGPLGGAIKVDFDLFLATVTGSYELVVRGEREKGRFELDAYAGVRVYSTHTTVTTTVGHNSDSSAWVDPIVGLDLRYGIEKWLFRVRADIGGFDLSSELAWSVTVGVRYQFTKLFSAGVGYGWLDVDYEGGGSVTDVQLAGPFLALVFVW